MMDQQADDVHVFALALRLLWLHFLPPADRRPVLHGGVSSLIGALMALKSAKYFISLVLINL